MSLLYVPLSCHAKRIMMGCENVFPSISRTSSRAASSWSRLALRHKTGNDHVSHPCTLPAGRGCSPLRSPSDSPRRDAKAHKKNNKGARWCTREENFEGKLCPFHASPAPDRAPKDPPKMLSVILLSE